MRSSGNLLGTMRPPFLILTPACVLLGLATAVQSSEDVSIVHFLLALVGAIGAHVSVNALNEYFDFKSGLDMRTTRTPFSGGSGTLPARPDLARGALVVAIVAVAISALVGVYFLSVRGPSLLPLALLGLLVVLAYTPWLTHSPFLCLIAPGLGFGTLMVMGTHFVLTGGFSWTSFVACWVPFFLVSNLLLLNQFPDVEADRSVGRRHLPIVIGRRASSLVFGTLLLLAHLTVVVGVQLGLLPLPCLLALLMLVLAVPTALGVYRHYEDTQRLTPFMVRNVVINILMPVLVSVGLFIG